MNQKGSSGEFIHDHSKFVNLLRGFRYFGKPQYDRRQQDEEGTKIKDHLLILYGERACPTAGVI